MTRRTCGSCLAGIFLIDVAFTTVSLGSDHACALTEDGTAYCWGGNGFGQLGDDGNADRAQPAPVATGLRFISISAGTTHTCGLSSDGRVHCWGSNSSGQLGAGVSTGPESCRFGLSCSRTPIEVESDLSFDRLRAGSGRTCGIAQDGLTYCWGSNFAGALGDGSTAEGRPVPVPVARQ